MAAVEHAGQSSERVLMVCQVCNITITDRGGIEAHFTGKKHRKNLFNKRQNDEGRSVYINNLGQLSLSDLHSYLAQFGTICNIDVGKDFNNQENLRYAIVTFEKEEVVLDLLSNTKRNSHAVPFLHSSSNRCQRIRMNEVKSRKKRTRSPSPVECESYDVNQILLRLVLVFDIEEQIEELVSFTELQQEHIDERNSLCAHIRKAFADRGFPECCVSPFGSTVNGLGFKGCDLDVFIDLGSIPSQHNPHLSSVPVSYSQTQKVQLATKILRQIPHCARVTPITAARVPILKFVHRRSGIQCDVSFKDRTSVINSEFIRFCVDLDSRVRPLMMTVRFIFKRYELAGGGGGQKLSNYSLTLLLIFYLQQLENPILYTLHQLQQAYVGEKEMINGWNCSFSTDINTLPPLPVNKQGLLELLTGFFTYYATFDFAGKILCPHIGSTIPKDVSEETLPAQFSHIPASFLSPSLIDGQERGRPQQGLATDKPLCLQDPFELSFNPCRNLNLQTLQQIQVTCSEATSVCQLLAKPQTRPPGGLVGLFKMAVSPQQRNTVNWKQFSEKTGANIWWKVFQLPVSKKASNNMLADSVKMVETIFGTCLKFQSYEQNRAVKTKTEVDPVPESSISKCATQANSSTEGSNPSQSSSSSDKELCEQSRIEVKVVENPETNSNPDESCDKASETEPESTSIEASSATELLSETAAVAVSESPTSLSNSSTVASLSNSTNTMAALSESASPLKRTLLDSHCSSENKRSRDDSEEESHETKTKEEEEKVIEDGSQEAEMKEDSPQEAKVKEADSQEAEVKEDSHQEAKVKEADSQEEKMKEDGFQEAKVKEKDKGEEDAKDEERKKGKREDEWEMRHSSWKVMEPVWLGRKRVATAVNLQGTSHLSHLQIEERITEKLLLDSGAVQLADPVAVFTVHIARVKSQIWIGLEKISSRKHEYENMFEWMTSYLPSIAKKVAQQ